MKKLLILLMMLASAVSAQISPPPAMADTNRGCRVIAGRIGLDTNGALNAQVPTYNAAGNRVDWATPAGGSGDLTPATNYANGLIQGMTNYVDATAGVVGNSSTNFSIGVANTLTGLVQLSTNDVVFKSGTQTITGAKTISVFPLIITNAGNTSWIALHASDPDTAGQAAFWMKASNATYAAKAFVTPTGWEFRSPALTAIAQINDSAGIILNAEGASAGVRLKSGANINWFDGTGGHVFQSGITVGGIFLQTNHSSYALFNGIVNFTNEVSGISPLYGSNFATRTFVETAIDQSFPDTLYGATNAHPVLPAGFASFWPTIPIPGGPAWTNTLALVAGTNAFGNRFSTNAIMSYVPAGTYQHQVYQFGSGAGLAASLYFSDLAMVKSDGSVTQTLVRGSVVVPTSTIEGQVSTSFLPTNVVVPSGTWYLGVLRYGVRNGGAVTLNILGGSSAYPTHLNGPAPVSSGVGLPAYQDQPNTFTQTNTFSGTYHAREYTNTYQGTAWSADFANGNVQSVILTNNNTIMLTNMPGGIRCTLTCFQDGTGGRSNLFVVPTGFKLAWPNQNVTPTNTAVANGWDIFGFIRNGTNISGATSGLYQ